MRWQSCPTYYHMSDAAFKASIYDLVTVTATTLNCIQVILTACICLFDKDVYRSTTSCHCVSMLMAVITLSVFRDEDLRRSRADLIWLESRLLAGMIIFLFSWQPHGNAVTSLSRSSFSLIFFSNKVSVIEFSWRFEIRNFSWSHGERCLRVGDDTLRTWFIRISQTQMYLMFGGSLSLCASDSLSVCLFEGSEPH